MDNYIIQNIHINDVKIGDTVLCNDGNIRTVCRNNIRYSEFFGTLLFGDSYNLGTIPVKKVIFKINK